MKNLKRKTMCIRLLSLIIFSIVFSACNGSASDTSANSNSSGANPPSKVADSVIKLSWTASTGSPTAYEIDSSTDGANFIPLQTVNTTTTQITGLPRGATYYFRIRALNSSGDSAFTPLVSVSI